MKKKVVKHLSRVVDGARRYYGEKLSCGHVWHYVRTQAKPRRWRAWRSCVECSGKPIQARSAKETTRAGPPRPMRVAGDPQVAVLRAALRRLIETTRTSPAPAAVRRFCFEALGADPRTDEALMYVDTLQQLGDVVVEFLNGHPFCARAMELREEMSRLCQVTGLLPSTTEEPEAPGTPRRLVPASRED